MDLQNDYQYVMIPQQLSSCLDANCGKMLTTLLGLSSLMKKEDGWFYRSNTDLQGDTRLGETLVRATLDTLYLAGIIDIDCVGKGRGHRSNRIHINFESFKKYQQYSFNDIRNNPDLWINTIKYKGSGFSTSYSKKSSQNTSQDISQNTSQKVRTNTDTTDTSHISNTKESIDNKENKLSKEIKNESQKVNTCIEGKLPTCKIDIVEEEKSFKEFEEESLQNMRDSFNIYCSKVKLNNEMRDKGYKCCEDFYERNQTLDYQLLLRNSQQFLEDNDFKLTMLTQKINLTTGITFTKRIATELLKEYVVGIPA